MKVYGISGLGADERVFQAVNCFLEEEIEYVPWIEPQLEESLAHYAKRMAETLDTSEPYVLIGLSFGGMIASEMNKHIQPERTIIISSCAVSSELPRFFKSFGQLKLVPYIPTSLLRLPGPLLDAITSLKAKGDKDLMHDIMKHTNRDFLKWAVQSILTWDNEQSPKKLKRIHGKADRLLPLKVRADDLIEGGHLVIIEKPEEMARLIKKEMP